MKKFALVFTLLLPGWGQQPQPAPASAGGTLSGTLTGDDGTLIGGALVAFGLLPPYQEGRLRQTEWTTTSAADGSFQVGELPFGSYQICVQAPGTAWLNPCDWGLQPQVVSLTSDQPTASANVVVNKGAVVPVRLSDPGGFLSQFETKVATANVLIGVRTDALFFRRAQAISSDATGRNHQVIIPFGPTVNLVVATSFFQLTNAAGVAFAKNSAAIPITVQPGQQPALVTVVVTGGGQP